MLGSHEESPVDRLSLSFDRKYLASSSYDSIIKIWEIDADGGEEAELSDEEKVEAPSSPPPTRAKSKKNVLSESLKANTSKKPKVDTKAIADFFHDL